ncbi:DNA repair protein RadC [Clostridium sp. 19966]|uniref:RadC family protein n=1 Tax=Clostridium sp. 19966 TaxID=2768166 RepID=UPI0028DEFBD9|nr:DNA repair protein RadC [Clostridium sp. 19966]MDT8715269.1 DNA repair protein RadC [Clostridium sp. 19966]
MNVLKIMDLPQNERPQEKLFRYGVDTLSNTELMAVVLRNGIQGDNIINLCARILKECGGINGLLDFSAEDFMKIKGVKHAKAAQILAMVELSKRLKSYKSGEEFKITQPSDAAYIVMESMRSLKQEMLKVLHLNTKNIVTLVKDVSLGTVNSSIVHPREVFSEAVKRSSTSIIICHNHPSGDPTPSNEDINITLRLKECGKLLGIELLDHVIIGNGIYVSLKDKGII